MASTLGRTFYIILYKWSTRRWHCSAEMHCAYFNMLVLTVGMVEAL